MSTIPLFLGFPFFIYARKPALSRKTHPESAPRIPACLPACTDSSGLGDMYGLADHHAAVHNKE